MTSYHELNEFGKLGEMWVVQELRRRGFVCEWIGKSSDYDLLIEGRARAEVKAAFCSPRPGNRQPRWQFSLRRHGLLVDEDLLFLLCWDGLEVPLATFIIPGSAVPETLSKIDITSSDPSAYRGQWAVYYEDWAQVNRIVSLLPMPEQLVLFREQRYEEIPF